MNFAKYLFFVLLLLVAVGAGCSKNPEAPSPQAKPEAASVETPAAAEIQATLIVDKKTYAATIEQGATALELMNLISQRHDLTFSGKDYGELGLFIETIDGVTNDPGTQQYWTLYVNGAMAETGVSSYILQDGDTVEWRFEHLSFEETEGTEEGTEGTENVANTDEDDDSNNETDAGSAE